MTRQTRRRVLRAVDRRSRGGRFVWLARTFPDLERYRVVDLGGRAKMWRQAPVRPKSVLLLNLEKDLTGNTPEPWLEERAGDACDPPADLSTFDLVFSNSTIEHVGGIARRREFADAVRALAPRYWIQTPYRYFPIEPHWLAPGAQFLPLRAKAELVRRWPLSLRVGEPTDTAVMRALWVELLTKTEMTHLFPEGELVFERVAGLPKSLVAIRR